MAARTIALTDTLETFTLTIIAVSPWTTNGGAQ